MCYIEEEGILVIEVNLIKINILEFLVRFLYRVESSACQTFGLKQPDCFVRSFSVIPFFLPVSVIGSNSKVFGHISVRVFQNRAICQIIPDISVKN